MRGSIQDLFFWGALTIGAVFLGYIYYGITLQVTPVCNGLASDFNLGANGTLMCAQPQNAINNFLAVIPIALTLGGLGILILASFLPVPRIFLPIGFILWLVAVVFYWQVQSAFDGIFADSFFTSATLAYPLPAMILRNISWFILAFGAALLIVMYRSGGIRGRGTPEG